MAIRTVVPSIVKCIGGAAKTFPTASVCPGLFAETARIKLPSFLSCLAKRSNPTCLYIVKGNALFGQGKQNLALL